MSHNLRKEVLRAFRCLHKARKNVFEGDHHALEAGRIKINEEFRKYKNVTDQDAIKELIQLAKEVEKELRANVIQAVQVAPDKFQLKITADTAKFDSVPCKEKEFSKN